MSEPWKRRKGLGNAKRFAIFQRDRFTCVYCGRKPPGVILEVDHVHPVAEGGTDDELNLVTSCRECNAGKRTKILDVPPPTAEDAVDEINEREEQLREYSRAAMAVRTRINLETDCICTYLFDCELPHNHPWAASIRGALKKMAFVDLMDICDDILGRTYVQTNEHRFRYLMSVYSAKVYPNRLPRIDARELPPAQSEGTNPDDIPV